MSEAAPTRPIRWGIIGCGAVTEVKSGPAFQQIPGSQLHAMMRRDGARARDYAQRHGVPRWYDDAQALIDDAQVDAVYVATPPSSHKRYALMSIAAGKPVYIEKPMALDAAECAAIVEAGQAAGVPVFVAYYRRMLPRFHAVRRLLFEQRAIGTPRQIEVSYQSPLNRGAYADPSALPWRVQPAIAGGGLFVDLGSHTLDMLDWLFGPLLAVSGQATNQAGAYPAEDRVTMSFAFASGVQGRADWNFCGDAHHDRIEVIGGQGRLRFSTFGDTAIVLENSEGVREWRIENPTPIQQPLIETIVAELRGQAGACPSSGPSAARTSAVIDQVLASYRRGH
jgi:1,5-anhydro-D-fructose reductase (1,5-anhydro-D-mannitol-forming)